MKKDTIRNHFVMAAIQFIVLLIGLPLIGVHHWLWIALGIGVTALIPTLGVSASMIIWIFCVMNVTQNLRQSYWLMLLYIILMILEQLLIPVFPRKWDTFGAEPVEMVLAATAGYLITVMHPVGILIGPIVYLLGKKLLFTFFEPRSSHFKKGGYFNTGFRSVGR